MKNLFLSLSTECKGRGTLIVTTTTTQLYQNELRILQVDENQTNYPEEILTSTCDICYIRSGIHEEEHCDRWIEFCQLAKMNHIDFTIEPYSSDLFILKLVNLDSLENSKDGTVNLDEFLIHSKLTKLNSEYIVPLLTCLMSKSKVFGVLPYYPRGNLLSYLSSSSSSLPEGQIQQIMYSMVQGVNVCHENYICHRDVTLDNFILVNDTRVRLLDFGNSKDFSLMNNDFIIHDKTMSNIVGKAMYLAPELLDIPEHHDSYDASKVDIWALGICLFILFAKLPPWNIVNNSDRVFDQIVKRNNLRGVLKVSNIDISPLAVNLLESLLSLNPQDRPTSKQILQHDWFQWNFEK